MISSIKSQNIGINEDGALPDSKAILDISSANKGVIIPRVALTNADNPISGTKPIGLLVWNTKTDGNYTKTGFYFWDGNNWSLLGTGANYWQKNGNNVYFDNNVGIGTMTPQSKLEIRSTGTDPDYALFVVKDKEGDTVMAVFNSGVHIYVEEEISKAKSKGFVVKSRSKSAKGVNTDIFTIGTDSVCVLLSDSMTKAKSKGFVVKSRSKSAKNSLFNMDYLRLTPDYTRLYTKNKENGFSVLNRGETEDQGYMQLSPLNSFIGHLSGKSTAPDTVGGKYNTFIGDQSGFSNTKGSSNVMIGYQSGYKNTTGSLNVFMGHKSGYENIKGGYNVFIGDSSGYHNTTGHANVFLGPGSGFSSDTAWHNIFMGSYSGYSNKWGMRNTFMGTFSGYKNVLGHDNIFMGTASGFSHRQGNHNIFIGSSTGESVTSGIANIFIGSEAGKYHRKEI